MATLTTIFLPHNSYYYSHSKPQCFHSLTPSNSLPFRLYFFSLPRLQRTGYAVSRAIGSPNFDLKPLNFDDDDNGGGNSRRRRRRRKSDRWSKRQRWWSDEDDVEEEDDEVEGGILEQIVVSLWILRVLKSYGWFSPIILSSLLIATGPKAFLMAFSLPCGLSLVIFAFQKLQEWLVGISKPQHRRKRRSKFGRKTDAFMDEEDDQEESQQGKRNKIRDYQSWVVRNNGSFNKSDSSSRVNVNNFGSWDDMVGEDERQGTQRPSREIGRLETMMEKERLSRSTKERDLPMLLRLLIAVFPPLALWTNLL